MDKIRFPSDEWIKAFKEELNKNENYERYAKTWEGDFLFIVNSGLDKEYVFYVDLYHGKCRDAYMVESRESKQAAYTFEGSYENWKKLISGKMDPIQALVTGSFKLKGDMGKVLRYTAAASELIKTASKIPTEFA